MLDSEVLTMSDNRKSVFLSNISLKIIGSFSSGRLNAIIERYGILINADCIDGIFSKAEMQILYDISKESATREKSSWEDLKATKLIFKIKQLNLDFNKEEFISKLLNINKNEEMALVEKIESYWLDERVRLFNEYRENKIRK
jgi:hypothetical protein